MTDNYNQIDPCDIKDNLIKLIRDDWFLVTAGNLENYNTMTASWGSLGELWSRKVAFVFVRPTRHTYDFTEKYDSFTMSFFEESHRDALKFCGTKSGRDYDKAKECGLTPVSSESGSVYFSEARLVLDCRKIYNHDLDPKLFIDPTIDKEYPKKDYHRMYIGEILSCLEKK